MAALKNGITAVYWNGVDKDLGNIKLEVDAAIARTLLLQQNKPLYELNLDKKVYNVEKDINHRRQHLMWWRISLL